MELVLTSHGQIKTRANKMHAVPWLRDGWNRMAPHSIDGPGSSVGIATDYGLDGPGIESRWGRDCPHVSRPALGLTQPPVQCIPGLSRA